MNNLIKVTEKLEKIRSRFTKSLRVFVFWTYSFPNFRYVFSIPVNRNPNAVSTAAMDKWFLQQATNWSLRYSSSKLILYYPQLMGCAWNMNIPSGCLYKYIFSRIHRICQPWVTHCLVPKPNIGIWNSQPAFAGFYQFKRLILSRL